MRSRYSAHVKQQIDYLVNTVRPSDRTEEYRQSAREWAEKAQWLGLEILKVYGKESDDKGQVEFIARYKMDGIEQAHHEVSRFKKLGGFWYFTTAKVVSSVPAGIEVSRNALCPCGSGRKFKRCCGSK